VTSNYPVVAGSGFVSRSGSNGVSGYVAQSHAVGSITFVEYSYALTAGFPVVKVLNAAGYYTEPTASNVAVALLSARINEDQSSADYLTQDLSQVYTSPDPRVYVLSSYSYIILPTALEMGFSEDKGLTLADFGAYFLCEGQQYAEILGYSPLPINLVQAGQQQIQKIPGGDPVIKGISACNNPTFSPDGANRLAAEAPYPPECDRQGAQECATGTGGAADTPTDQTRTPDTTDGGGGGTSGGGTSGGGSTGTSGGGTSGGGSNGTSGGGGSSGTDGSGSVGSWGSGGGGTGGTGGSGGTDTTGVTGDAGGTGGTDGSGGSGGTDGTGGATGSNKKSGTSGGGTDASGGDGSTSNGDAAVTAGASSDGDGGAEGGGTSSDAPAGGGTDADSSGDTMSVEEDPAATGAQAAARDAVVVAEPQTLPEAEVTPPARVAMLGAIAALLALTAIPPLAARTKPRRRRRRKRPR
jgi:hypothetical protein